MYERFTDRSRKVLQLANQEAMRFNHEYVGTEHILLGLIKEGSGVASTVLKNLDMDLRKIRLEVEKRVQAGPDMVALGKLPHTPLAKKVIEYSIETARELNHNYVGTEHLLLGLVREKEGLAAKILQELGVVETAIADVLNLLGVKPKGNAIDALVTENIPQTQLQLQIEQAIAEHDFEKAIGLRKQKRLVEQAASEIRKDDGNLGRDAQILREIAVVLARHDDGECTSKAAVSEILHIIG